MLYTSRMRGVEIDDGIRAQLRDRGRGPDVPWWVRDRIEMILLGSEGWSAPRMGRHLGCSAGTVRRVLRTFRAHGLAALERRLPGPAPDEAYQHIVQQALDDLLGRPRTWTAVQLSEELRRVGIVMGPRQVRRYLAGMGSRWRRTKNSLAHKQDPNAVERARRRLDALKKKPAQGAWISSSSTSAGSPRRSRQGTPGLCPAGGTSSRSRTRGAAVLTRSSPCGPRIQSRSCASR